MYMKAPRFLSLFIASTVTVSSVNSHAIEITTSDDANVLANVLTLFGDTGIDITSATLSSPSPLTSGTYTNSPKTYGLPSPGIVLSTGNVNHYNTGPNTQEGNSTSFDNGGGDEGEAELPSFAAASINSSSLTNTTNWTNEQLLDPITGGENNNYTHYDTTRLTITFNVDDITDTLSFLSVFGSEEFPEYVGSEFVDGFGLYLNGENFAGVIDSNSEPGQAPLAININHPDMTNEIEGTELNGIIAPNGNPLLRFDVPVTPGSTNNVFDIIIADTSDSSLDTTVFIAAFGGEGSSEFIPVLPSNGEPDENGEFHFELPTVPNDTIWIDPVVSVGYVYNIKDGFFTKVTMPSLAAVNDPTGYELWINGLLVKKLASGETYDFDANDQIDTFEIRGIDPVLELDPLSDTAFVTGILYDGVQGTAPAQVSMKAITIDTDATSVPEPSTLAVFALGLIGLSIRRFKQQ